MVAVVDAVAPKPVNMLVWSNFTTVADMKRIGVRRISVGGALAPQELFGHFVRYTHYMVYEAKRFQQVYEWMRSWGLASGDADHAKVVASIS